MLQHILNQLTDKEKTVKEIHVDCEQYGAQYGDVQKFIKQLLLGLTSNIQVIRENQNFVLAYLEKLKNKPVDEEKQILPPETTTKSEVVVTPETHAMSTQTFMEQPTDNIMVIQSMNAEGETIQIYNMPSSHEEGKEDDRNVIIEAKYIRGHSGDPKRASELVLKNIPKHFETTFVEPDETTTEIIVNSDGSKRIIVRKLSKTTQQIVKHEEYEGEALPEHIFSQLGLSGTTHDVIIGSPNETSFEHHSGITESSLHAVVEHVSHRLIKKTRKIIKKIVIIDGQEHITEEVIDEPDEVEEFSEERPAVEYEIVHQTEPDQTRTVVIPDKIIIEDLPMPATEAVIQFKDHITDVSPETAEEPKTETIVKIPEEEVLEKISEKMEITEVDQTEIDENQAVETEGEIQIEQQVFETVTEAPVELKASEVDKLAPIDDIKNIWPYETPHIASQSILVEILDKPAPSLTPQDKDSLDIWPQNLTIGSNIDFNKYLFERTLEQSPDNLENNSFVNDSGLTASEEPSTVESRSFVEISDQQEITALPKENEVDVVETCIEESKENLEIVSSKDDIEKIEESEMKLEVIQPLQDEESESPDLAKTPTDETINQPQMAKITIVKTLTFLEQERINATTMMIVTKDVEVEPSIEQTQSDPELSKELEKATKILDLLTVDDQSVPEEIVQQIDDQVSQEKKEQEHIEIIKSDDDTIETEIDSELLPASDKVDSEINANEENHAETIISSSRIEISTDFEENLSQPEVPTSESQVESEPAFDDGPGMIEIAKEVLTLEENVIPLETVAQNAPCIQEKVNF